jgi:hypothetical protein
MGSVRVSSQILPRNRGGIEFPNYDGVILDVGFAVGQSPRGQAERPVIFRDRGDQTCLVTAKEVFERRGDEFELRFSDAALKTWLRNRCPILSVWE